MTTKACGCTSETCGCCEGTKKWTPLPTLNRPGLKALLYRVGTHGAFFETMKARLATMIVEATSLDGQTIETFSPLTGLTTRDTSDPAIALLDGWATVGDVLTFYQERIANEGYLRTATERRSILELARLVGYTLRPGVAATVFLAYALEDTQVGPVEIPAGARSQSVPGPGELPQSFETSESLITRREWNNLQVRLTRPQNLTLDSALEVNKLYLSNPNANLQKGDQILLVFGGQGRPSVVRIVAKAEGQFAQNRTEVDLQPTLPTVVLAVRALKELVTKGDPLLSGLTEHDPEVRLLKRAKQILNSANLGVAPPPVEWELLLLRAADQDLNDQIDPLFDAFMGKLRDILGQPPAAPAVVVTDPSKFVGQLLKPPVVQAASRFELNRSLNLAFKKKSDVPAQLLVNFVLQLKDTYYTAWANADVNDASAALTAVYVLRAEAPLFGAGVPKQPTYFDDNQAGNDPHKAGQLKPQSQWLEWDLEKDETNNALFLDQADEAILPNSYVVLQRQTGDGPVRLVQRVVAAQTLQRTAYGISGKTTQLTFEDPWWAGAKDSMAGLRGTLVFGRSEELPLAEEPITSDVSGQEIELAGLFNELSSGRWVILAGERADIPAVSGVKASELLMISGLRHDYDKTLPGDKTHTTLLLATNTAYVYKRDKLTIYGNVTKATHGETTNETLGSGDGSQEVQSFVLKQPPLTFVPSPTPAGVASTLKVYVNQVEWHEVDTLAGLGPRDRNFITSTDDADNTTVIFGNGTEGTRLPTGVLNVNSTYRKGIGKAGNVLAEQISLLQTKPLGVKSVLNPLRASGGADKEKRDQARENAPLAVMALDRLVSLRDYADFTRTFAGIAKASVKRLSDSHRQFIHLTIAGADDMPIDPVSDLYRNLVLALQNLGDLSVAVKVEARELVVLVLSAKISLKPAYQWEPVAEEIRTALLSFFGFEQRALGQPALLCEVIGCIQSVTGVAYVDVDAFGGIPEKTTDKDGIRRLLTLEQMSDTVDLIVNGTSKSANVPTGPAETVISNLADFTDGVLHPAQLAIFTPTVQDTIVLNQIK